MTATYDPAEAERLVREAREDDARMTRAPWTTPAGTRFLGAVSAIIGGVERQVAASAGQAPQFDDVPDVGRALADNAAAIARTRNNLRAMADQLEAARAEIDRVQRVNNLAFDAARDQHAAALATARTEGRNEASRDMIRVCGERDDARRQLEAARARVADLEGAVRGVLVDAPAVTDAETDQIEHAWVDGLPVSIPPLLRTARQLAEVHAVLSAILARGTG